MKHCGVRVKNGLWYKRYSKASEPSEVLFEFIESFVSEIQSRSLEDVFVYFDSEAYKMARCPKELQQGKVLSESWFRYLFCSLVMSVAKEKNRVAEMEKKLNVIFEFCGGSDQFINYVPVAPEHVGLWVFGNSSVPLLYRVTDSFHGGTVYRSRSGILWMVVLERTDSVVCTNLGTGKNRTFAKDILLKMSRVFEEEQ